MAKKILDDNHGIETINYGKQYVYLPWFFDKAKGGKLYYKSKYTDNSRIECASYLDAYNHIARSRRLPTLYSRKARSS